MPDRLTEHRATRLGECGGRPIPGYQVLHNRMGVTRPERLCHNGSRGEYRSRRGSKSFANSSRSSCAILSQARCRSRLGLPPPAGQPLRCSGIGSCCPLAQHITFFPESNNRRIAIGWKAIEELGAVHALPAPKPTAKGVALFGQSVGLPVDGLLLYSACHRSCPPALRGERGACTPQTVASRENECFGWESYVIPTCQNRRHR